MDLTTKYLGLTLKNPLVVAASPLTEKVDKIKQMEKAGASAIVMHSLFEEQITHETYELQHHLTNGTESFAEALTYFPEPKDFRIGPEEYLKSIREAKEAVAVPVIASLNGHSTGGWTEYALKMQEAGADAIELNIYYLPTDPMVSAQDVEENHLEILNLVKSRVKIPVAVKLSPYFSALAHMAKRLDEAGADGLVLFNRFYQPDINLETLDIVPSVVLSTPFDMRLPLRWVAILRGHVKGSLAATSGVHDGKDAVKMIMAGADAVMLCSALLKNGIGHISALLEEMEAWMEDHEYESVEQMKGSLSQKNCPDPAAFERANYMKTIKSWTGEPSLR